MAETGQSDADQMIKDWPRCIHLAGADGTGKTTQAKAIVSYFQNLGIRTKPVWLRFPRFLSIPFLVFARLKGYSHREVVNAVEHGYWNFDNSRLMKNVFPWALLVDTWIMAIYKIYIPLWFGFIVVCDRFVLDILVDLMVGIKDLRFDEKIPGSFFLSILPRKTKIVILDLDTDLAKRRSSELRGDRSQEKRRQIYLELARRRKFPVLSSDAPITFIQKKLLNEIRYKMTLADPNNQSEYQS